MGSFVYLEDPFEFTLREVRTRGLKRRRDNMGEKLPGHQITVEVALSEVERIQRVWDVLNAFKPTPFFGVNGNRNWLTIKAMNISENQRRTCFEKSNGYIHVDIMFDIGSIWVDASGKRYPQIKMKGLKKVVDNDEPVALDDF